ncbi:cytochrome P450 2D17-like [Lingula anatina]|uniref:Cytochrome P450 2D17-like n=1 Tax=Lingula anatina TaxID=7574 RepID=A0A1S3HYZ7_LINAN|nr:cytochrome P450 2D17-like [Lingula anatina]|eukprot:XP_013391247.1 cytochrome P450 2D17-like [Lingula anatina]
MIKWAEKYGNIFTVKMGTTTTVILNGYEAIRDVFQRKGALSSGRPHIPTFGFLGGRGILCADYSTEFQRQRNFIIKYLSKLDVEKQMENEIDALIQYIRHKNGQRFDFNSAVSASASNIIGAILFGSRHDYDDPDFQALIEAYHSATKLSSQASIQNFLPYLWFLPQCKISAHAWDSFSKSVNRILYKHIMGYNACATRGLVDAMMHQTNENDQNDQPLFDLEDIKSNSQTLYLTGSETSSSTLTWGMLFLLSYPDVCNKLQSELDEVVGKLRRPTLDDRPNLPFTCATLLEIQRCNNITPISAPHKATKDIRVHGYLIPKETRILANYWSIFMNEAIWTNPSQFQPMRFLDECGNLKKVEGFIPFSLGKRSCPGESLAKPEMFLLLTALVQAFTFHVPDGEVLPATVGTTGSVYVPPKFNVCARPSY